MSEASEKPRRQISFNVPGIPQPRGSKRAMPNRAGGRPLMVDTNAKSKPWMAAVSAAAAEAMSDAALMQGPLRLKVTFMFPRPKSHFRTGRNAHVLKPLAPERVSKKPDVDKLLRAVCDAMTGIVFFDDAQVASVEAEKWYGEAAMLGVIVTAYESQQEPAQAV